jgi:enoyl-CoA hydratase/carnithine racemase
MIAQNPSVAIAAFLASFLLRDHSGWRIGGKHMRQARARCAPLASGTGGGLDGALSFAVKLALTFIPHGGTGRVPRDGVVRSAGLRRPTATGYPMTTPDIVTAIDGHVATIEICRPPYNFFDIGSIGRIADALEAFDADPTVRAVVLAAQGQTFCAGAELGDSATSENGGDPASGLGPIGHLYREAVRIFRARKPIVAAVHGAAVGGGLGLAVSADFRVTCPEARFCANFTKLGFHPGFGLTVTLPELIGRNAAELMFYTSRRVTGEDAYRIGLANVLVAKAEVRAAAHRLAAEIAECAPLGLLATRATLRAGLAERVSAATELELSEQTRLRATEDFREGVRAMAERRRADFVGR